MDQFEFSLPVSNAKVGTLQAVLDEQRRMDFLSNRTPLLNEDPMQLQMVRERSEMLQARLNYARVTADELGVEREGPRTVKPKTTPLDIEIAEQVPPSGAFGVIRQLINPYMPLPHAGDLDAAFTTVEQLNPGTRKPEKILMQAKEIAHRRAAGEGRPFQQLEYVAGMLEYEMSLSKSMQLSVFVSRIPSVYDFSFQILSDIVPRFKSLNTANIPAVLNFAAKATMPELAGPDVYQAFLKKDQEQNHMAMLKTMEMLYAQGRLVVGTSQASIIPRMTDDEKKDAARSGETLEFEDEPASTRMEQQQDAESRRLSAALVQAASGPVGSQLGRPAPQAPITFPGMRLLVNKDLMGKVADAFKDMNPEERAEFNKTHPSRWQDRLMNWLSWRSPVDPEREKELAQLDIDGSPKDPDQVQPQDASVQQEDGTGQASGTGQPTVQPTGQPPQPTGPQVDTSQFQQADPNQTPTAQPPDQPPTFRLPTDDDSRPQPPEVPAPTPPQQQQPAPTPTPTAAPQQAEAQPPRRQEPPEPRPPETQPPEEPRQPAQPPKPPKKKKEKPTKKPSEERAKDQTPFQRPARKPTFQSEQELFGSEQDKRRREGDKLRKEDKAKEKETQAEARKDTSKKVTKGDKPVTGPHANAIRSAAEAYIKARNIDSLSDVSKADIDIILRKAHGGVAIDKVKNKIRKRSMLKKMLKRLLSQR